MTNLLDNAVKYTETGGHVQVDVTPESDSEVQICVADTGIGIEDADLQLIFDRFHRVTGSKSNRIGGIGLGLPIVKKLVERHEGDIWVESEVGEGSRFYVTLRRDA